MMRKLLGLGLGAALLALAVGGLRRPGPRRPRTGW